MEDFLISKPAFDQAEIYYAAAMKEYARPEEDVVPYMVCENAYKAVLDYLHGYIQSQGRTLHEKDSAEMLLRECRLINETFHELNLDAFLHKDKNDDVLMDMNTVHHYMNLLRQTRKLVGLG